MVINLSKKILYTGGLLLFLIGSDLNAAQNQAKDIMINAYRYIGSMDQYAFDAVVIDDLKISGPAARLYKTNISVKVQRPGNFRVDVIADKKERSKYLDNGIFTIFDHGSRYYAQIKTAKTVDETLDILDEKYGMLSPLSALLYSDMDRRTKLTPGKYFGKQKVDGVECDYIAFKYKNNIIHIWIEAGDQPLIKSYRIIDTSDDGKSDSGGFLKWKNNKKISHSDFVFIVPEGAEKISINSADQ